MTKTQRWLLVIAAFMAGLALLTYAATSAIIRLSTYFAPTVVTGY